MKYTQKMRIADFYSRFSALGFTFQETEILRRAELTLSRWSERECGTDNGCIERDEKTGKPYWLNSTSMRRTRIADRETGAIKRVRSVIAAHPELTYYHQTDPRGCSLYIVRKTDLGNDPIDRVYNRGFACCI